MTPRAPVQDGRPLRTGVVSVEDQQAEIRGNNQPMTGRVPLTPAQQRALAEDRYPGEDVPPGYEAGHAVVRPARPRDESQPLEDAWNRIDADAAAAERSGNADVAARAAVLRTAAQQGKEIIRRARANGTADAATIQAGAKLAERIATGLKELRAS